MDENAESMIGFSLNKKPWNANTLEADALSVRLGKISQHCTAIARSACQRHSFWELLRAKSIIFRPKTVLSRVKQRAIVRSVLCARAKGIDFGQ